MFQLNCELIKIDSHLMKFQTRKKNQKYFFFKCFSCTIYEQTRYRKHNSLNCLRQWENVFNHDMLKCTTLELGKVVCVALCLMKRKIIISINL
ncbi:hypothetical protein E2986_05504 [Frieseomelitta varia]|uniref:Uncharacterized protein n=1 Tax=Frieseomelitta varia TaxID=561572 RepID=A0A833VUQ4_9HYME|nr:hypothetical protein E2986_05504 [Frieseomelitta varia]